MENQKAPRRSKSAPKKSERVRKPRQWFKSLRLAKGLSQSKMASELDVSVVTLRSTENGTNDPSLMMSHVYALYLGGTVEEVFPDVVEEAKMYFQKLKKSFS